MMAPSTPTEKLGNHSSTLPNPENLSDTCTFAYCVSLYRPTHNRNCFLVTALLSWTSRCGQATLRNLNFMVTPCINNIHHF